MGDSRHLMIKNAPKSTGHFGCDGLSDVMDMTDY